MTSIPPATARVGRFWHGVFGDNQDDKKPGHGQRVRIYSSASENQAAVYGTTCHAFRLRLRIEPSYMAPHAMPPGSQSNIPWMMSQHEWHISCENDEVFAVLEEMNATASKR